MMALAASILMVILGQGLWITARKSRDERAAIIFFRASCAARAEGFEAAGTIWQRVLWHVAVQQKIAVFANSIFVEPMLFQAEGDQLIGRLLQLEKLEPVKAPYRQEIRDALFVNLEKASALSITLKEKHPLIADRIEEIVLRRVILDYWNCRRESFDGTDEKKAG